MQGDMKRKVPDYLVRHRRRRTWQKVICALACLAALCTICALVLPADTMEGTAYCGHEEHTHKEECYEKKLICGQKEAKDAAHVHSSACYAKEKELICGQEETKDAAHVHSSACYVKERELICGQEENTAVHTHTAECLSSEQKLICQNADPAHQHTEECYETVETYICGLEEGMPTGHVHTDTCYAEKEVLQCGLEEGKSAGHVHTDACYDEKEALQCGLEEGEMSSDHTHTEKCYESVLKCEKEEHTHELSCYSNPEADVETKADWEKSMADVKLTGDWRSDVIAVAESQIGYKESVKNYTVDEDGETKKGYTRYGAWYGNSYGDWCAMFVSFCLHYADIPKEAFPLEASCPRWIEELQKEEYNFYREQGSYEPKAGDLIFFDWDNDRKSDHVGLVAELTEATETEPARLRTIEGNSSDCVQYVTYERDDEQILGYGELPKNPEQDKQEETVPDKASADDETLMTLTYKGEDYTVQVSFTEEAQIPENAELSVRELTDEEYEECCQKAKEAMAVQELSFARFFDVSFMVDGKEIEPAAPVDVKITYNDPVEIPEDQIKNAVHFKEDGTEVLDTELEQKEDATTFTFTQDSFSVTGTAVGYAETGTAESTVQSGVQTSELKEGEWYILYAICTDGSASAYAISATDPTKAVPLSRASTTGGTVECTTGDDILWQYTANGFKNRKGEYLTLIRASRTQSSIGLGSRDYAVSYNSDYKVLYNNETTSVGSWGEGEFCNTVRFESWPAYAFGGRSDDTMETPPEGAHYIALVSENVDPSPVDPGPVDPGPADPVETSIPHQKTIDAFRDGADNPDTTLDNAENINKTDLYRLYLDAVLQEKSQPIDLLIVVDQSGSMHMNYQTKRVPTLTPPFYTEVEDEEKTALYKDMEDAAGNKIFRDEAVKLALNGTSSRSEYDNNPDIKANSLIAQFLALDPGNKVAVTEFRGEKDYSNDASTILPWTSSPEYIDVNGQKENGTNYCAGINHASALLDQVEGDGNKKVMVFISDGVPTYYLYKEGGAELRAGKGYWEEGTDCNTPSERYFDSLLQNCSDPITTYSIGVSKDISGTTNLENSNPEVLEYMANKTGGKFFGVNNTLDLISAVKQVLFNTYYLGLAIEDNLSEYVDLYEEQPDFKVTMTTEKGEKIVLYEGGKVTEDGKGKLKEVTYDAGKKKVSAIFYPNYKMEAGNTYTLSFNVKTTEDAYNYYATNGYPHTGDENTDYGENTTSSERPGFHSNDSATVGYVIGGEKKQELYDHPVVQVSDRELIVEKKWYFNNGELDTNMTNKPQVQFQLIQNIWQKPDPAEPVEPTEPVEPAQPKMCNVKVYTEENNNNNPWHFEELDRTLKEGSIVTLTFEINPSSLDKLTKNGEDVPSAEVKKGDKGERRGTYKYTYQFTLTEDTEINIKYIDWRLVTYNQTISYVEPEVTKPTEPTEPTKPAEPSNSDPVCVASVPYKIEGESDKEGNYTLSNENKWQWVFKNLPTAGKYNGKDAYYTYTVEEKVVSGYETTYENNDGVTTGTITIKNKSTTKPAYELPKTGGPGTIMYTTGGLLLMMAAWLLLSYRKNKCRKEDLASS